MTTNATYEIVPLPSGGSIVAVVKDGECFFSPRHVCEELGIQWGAQFVKIKADPVLSSTVSEIETVASDGKQRTMSMLPLSMLSGWLFTIKKVAPAAELGNAVANGPDAVARHCKMSTTIVKRDGGFLTVIPEADLKT